MSETDLVSNILDALAVEPGVFAWRNNTGAYRRGKNFIRYGKKGSADVFAVVRTTGPAGRFVGIECKVDKNDMDDDQKRFAANVRRVGGFYGVARSVADARNIIVAAKMGAT